jgi:Regulator of chromosome condensation (RCC1) repeat
VILPLAVSGGVASASPAADGTIKHWGAFIDGLTSPFPYDLQRSPVPLSLPGRIAEIATSNSSQYTLLANGSVYAWGLGKHGQLGDGSTGNSFTRPVRVRFPAGVKIRSIPIDVMPFDTALAVDTTGQVWGWGSNAFGELCLGNRSEYKTPVRLPLTHVTLLAGAGGHSLFDSRGRVYACGNNTYGELGNGSTRSSKVPVRVTGLGRGQVTSLVAAFASSGAVLASGRYYDWGYNGQGQVGNGVTGPSADVPFRVPLPAAVRQLSQGGSLQGNGQTITLLGKPRILKQTPQPAQQPRASARAVRLSASNRPSRSGGCSAGTSGPHSSGRRMNSGRRPSAAAACRSVACAATIPASPGSHSSSSSAVRYTAGSGL